MRCWFRSEVTHSFETLQFCWALIFGQLSIIWWLFYCHTLQLFTVILTILMFSGFCAIWKSGLNVSSSNAIYHSGLNVLSNDLCFSYRCDFDQETADNIFQFRESFYCDQQVVSKRGNDKSSLCYCSSHKTLFPPFFGGKKRFEVYDRYDREWLEYLLSSDQKRPIKFTTAFSTCTKGHFWIAC